jgi:nucleotide-binding universal stress UspA family protein
MASGVAAEPLRICFDASTEGAVEADAGGYDLVIVPAVWHRRSELLASVAALLRLSARRHRLTVELSVAYDEADRRLATQCDALIEGSGGRSELRVQRL